MKYSQSETFVKVMMNKYNYLFTVIYDFLCAQFIPNRVIVKVFNVDLLMLYSLSFNSIEGYNLG